MVDFNSQFSDAENAKAPPSVKDRTQSRRSRSLGDMKFIAGKDYRGQQSITGEGAPVVEAAKIT